MMRRHREVCRLRASWAVASPCQFEVATSEALGYARAIDKSTAGEDLSDAATAANQHTLVLSRPESASALKRSRKGL